MMTVFKQVFTEEYHDLVEETKVASGDAGFHLDKSMQDIGGALDHLSMVIWADKDIFTRLTEAFEYLTQNNASLTA